MTKLVSIITPCYNSSEFIAETIKSVISQTYTNWEMIIVDDLSTDNSIEIIESYTSKDERIKLVKLESNSGAAIARNTAIKKAKGSYIAFLDGDDIWLQNKLELQISFMQKNNYSLTFTAYNLIDEQSNTLNKTIFSKEKITYTDMLFSNKIGCLTAIYNKESLGEIFMPNIRKRQDYALWLKILKKIENANGLNVVLANYRIRSNSISNNKIEMIKWNWKLFYHVEKLSFVKSLYCVSLNVLNKIIKLS